MRNHRESWWCAPGLLTAALVAFAGCAERSGPSSTPPAQKEEPMPAPQQVAFAPEKSPPKPRPRKGLGIEWAGFTPDGKKIITLEQDGTLNVWDALKDNTKAEEMRPEKGLAEELVSGGRPLVFKDFVCYFELGYLVVWKWKTGKQIWRIELEDYKNQHGEPSLHSKSDHEVVVVSKHVYFVDLETGKVKVPFDMPFRVDDSRARCLTKDAKLGLIAERMVTAGKQAMHFVDMTNGKVLKTVSDRVNGPLAISPDGSRALSVQSHNEIREIKVLRFHKYFVWDLAKREVIREFEFNSNNPAKWSIVDSRLEKFIDLEVDNSVTIWDIGTKKNIGHFDQAAIDADRIILSPDEQSLLVVGGRKWRNGIPSGLTSASGPNEWYDSRAMAIYDLKTGKMLRTITYPYPEIKD